MELSRLASQYATHLVMNDDEIEENLTARAENGRTYQGPDLLFERAETVLKLRAALALTEEKASEAGANAVWMGVDRDATGAVVSKSIVFVAPGVPLMMNTWRKQEWKSRSIKE